MHSNGHLSSPSLSKSGSSSTLKDTSQLYGPDYSNVTPHNTLRRKRGMTTNGGGDSISSTQSRSFLWNASAPPNISLPIPPLNDQPPSPSSSTNPRMLIHKLSASRIVGPPSAPPSGGLPAPPAADSFNTADDETALRAVSPGSSSSSLSFALSTGRAEMGRREITQREMDRDSSNIKSSLGVHTVKRSLSHQNFSKRPSYKVGTTASGSSTPVERPECKSPRKQRSFHNNSRIVASPSSSLSSSSRQPPLPPPVPSQPQSPLSSSSPEPFTDQRKGNGSGTSTSVRRRLFSGSSSIRRPISQTFSAGDDYQSVFSADGGEQTQGVSSSTEPLGSVKSPTPSFRDGGPPSDHRSLSSPVPSSTSEYTPQKIISPAELLRMEASCNNEGSAAYDHYSYNTSTAHERSRPFAMSPSSPMSDRNGLESLTAPASPTHYIIDKASGTSTGVRRSPSTTSPVHHSLRPSISHNGLTGATPLFPSSTLPSSSIGLPPPPRPRRQTAIIDKDNSLTPPPIRRAKTTTGANAPLMRSLMKKPSFLEIEDEAYPKRPLSVASAFASSFLDLERGKDSFDTIRSDDEQEDS